MSVFGHCEKCSRYVHIETHKCSSFEISHNFWGDWTEKTINGYYIEDAIDRFANDLFSEDPGDPSKFDLEVKHGDKKYNVSAEADINFYVREIEK